MSNFAKSVLIVLVKVLRILLDDAGDMKLSQLISQLDGIVKGDGRPYGADYSCVLLGLPRELEKALNAVDQPRYAVSDKIALLDTSHAREEVERGKFVASERLKELLENGYEVHIVSTRQEFLPETADKCLFDLLPERNFWCCDQGLEEGGLNSPAQVDVWLRALRGIDYDGCNTVDLRVDLRLRPDGWHRKGQMEIQEEARRHGIVVNHR